MKKSITLILFLFIATLFMQCTPTATTTLEKESENVTITTEDKKEELKDEIKKELEEEEVVITTRPSKPTINETKPPSKPEKPAVMDISTATNILQGAWQWVETSRAIRGVGNQVATPQTIGYRKTAVFRGNNKCEILINDLSAGNYTYEIQRGTDQLFITFIAANGDTKHMENGPLNLSDNEFTILGGYNDRGATISYKRH